MEDAVKTVATREQICEVALLGFAENGVAATSIRDVAAQAGVSPGLVQHHFPTKDKLREAVSASVIKRTAMTFSDLPVADSPAGIMRELGDRVTRLARAHPEALRYVARLSADQDPAALEIFDALVVICKKEWERLAEMGALRADLDVEWSMLQVIVLILGSSLYAGALSRHLPEDWGTPDQLERWNQANAELFIRGFYSSE